MHRWAGIVVMVALTGCGASLGAPTGGFLAFGDSITQRAFAAPTAWSGPGLSAVGLPGYTSAEGASELDGALAAHRDVRVVGLAFGTNDVYRGNTPAAFHTMMRAMALKVRQAGKTPRLARIPYSPDAKMAAVPAFNQELAAIDTELGLTPGPDLYSWFLAHPDQLEADRLHPNAEGCQAIQRLWSEALTRP